MPSHPIQGPCLPADEVMRGRGRVDPASLDSDLWPTDADKLSVQPWTALQVERRRRLLAAADELPRFSPILELLLGRLAREDVRFAEVSELIEKDTSLASSLLRVVNSAAYGLAGTVTSVRHALSILGLEKTRNLVLAASVSRLWRQQPRSRFWSTRRFNLHSVSVAVLADLLAQSVRVEFPEGAFTAGLLHDIGKFLAASSLPEEFEAVALESEQQRRNYREAEFEHYGMVHQEASAAALEHWNLPAEIVRAVKFHHDPEVDSSTEKLNLSHLIAVADRYVNRAGFEFFPSFQNDWRFVDEALAELTPELNGQKIMREFFGEMEVLCSLYGGSS